MKTALLLALALLCTGTVAQDNVGTLHNATLREWHQASPANQFATISDLVERILNVNDPIAAAPKARNIQACINKVASNYLLGSQMVVDTAYACMGELGYLHR